MVSRIRALFPGPEGWDVVYPLASVVGGHADDELPEEHTAKFKMLELFCTEKAGVFVSLRWTIHSWVHLGR